MITLEAGALARAMKGAAAVVQARNTIPILSNVCLVSSGDMLEITTSDLDTEFRQRIAVSSTTDIAITADAQRLSAIAAAAQKGAQISLEMKDGRLTVKTGRSRFQLPVLPTADFPKLAFERVASTMTIAGKALAAAIERIIWSASTEESRYYLCGIKLHSHEGRTRIAATNGHTLMVLNLDAEWPDEAPGVIVPTRFANTLQRAASEADEVKLSWDEARIRAELGAVTLTGKLIDGTFPDYLRVIPPDSERTLVDPGDLRRAVRNAVLVSSDKTRCVRLSRSSEKIEITVADPDGGTSLAELPAEVEGRAFDAGFNAAYLVSLIDAIGGDTLEIHHQDPGSPALFRRLPAGPEQGVIMPMRI